MRDDRRRAPPAIFKERHRDLSQAELVTISEAEHDQGLHAPVTGSCKSDASCFRIAEPGQISAQRAAASRLWHPFLKLYGSRSYIDAKRFHIVLLLTENMLRSRPEPGRRVGRAAPARFPDRIFSPRVRTRYFHPCPPRRDQRGREGYSDDVVKENISDRLRAQQSAMDFAAFGSAASAPRKLKPSIHEVMNGTGGLNQGVPVRKSGTEEAGGFASYPAKFRPEELDA